LRLALILSLRFLRTFSILLPVLFIDIFLFESDRGNRVNHVLLQALFQLNA
jgi:hypothetical protein